MSVVRKRPDWGLRTLRRVEGGGGKKGAGRRPDPKLKLVRYPKPEPPRGRALEGAGRVSPDVQQGESANHILGGDVQSGITLHRGQRLRELDLQLRYTVKAQRGKKEKVLPERFLELLEMIA